MLEPAIGIYFSVPFCRSKCTYCNFASGVFPASEHAAYVKRLVSDLQTAGKWASSLGAELPRRVDTVYAGGGTPSLLEPELLKELFGALRAEFDIAGHAEITMECAPGQIAEPTLQAMVAVGVNRVSLGVQSFVDGEARATGRLHSRTSILEDLRRLRQAGIGNLNVDLIAGLAGQTFGSWDESVAALIDCGVPHASVYMLEVDEESRLGREILAGGSRYHAGLVPSDDSIARMYETAVARLDVGGLEQYEISNFATPGFASRHNLRYWQRRPYLGLGLDASSMLHEHDGPRVLRATTTDNLKEYLGGGTAPETEWLSRERQLEEAWFLGLRTNDGVDGTALEAQFGLYETAPGLAVADQLVRDGLLTCEDRRFRLTPRGRLIANDVFKEFLAEAAAS